MKFSLSAVIVCAILAAFESALARTGSDYYMPLREGNYLKSHTTGQPSGWLPRTMTYTFEGTDSISGNVYFRERGVEAADDGSFSNTFLGRWLAKDAGGNLLIGAVSGSSADFDSAIVLPAASMFFPNQSLVPGYSTTYPFSDYFMQDSTISDTATVSTPAGVFTGCIEKSETHYDSSGSVIFLEYHYFAPGVGMVLNQRVKPESEAHTDVLTEYVVATSVHGKTTATAPGSFGLSQNFPNPFNPATSISYKLNASGRVTLKVYDLLGREVATLVNESSQPGEYSVKFDGAKLSSGVYFYKLQSGESSVVRRMILMK